MGGMTDLKTIVSERLAELGLKPIPAATAVGLERGYIRDIVAGRKKSVSSDKIPLLAKALQLDASRLSELSAVPAAAAQPNVRPADVPVPSRNDMPRDVPVMGTAAASSIGKGAFQFEGGIIDYVARPPGLARAREVYALFVENSSMEPALHPGDLIFVSPHRPFRVGDHVVIQEPGTHDGDVTAYVKIFERRTAEHIVTRQLNPPAEVKFGHAERLVVHKVLTMNELFGV